MRERSGAKRRKVRGKQTNTQFADGLGDVVRETTRLWRKHHLGYDQTKDVVELVRRRLTRRTVNRLDKIQVQRLICGGKGKHRAVAEPHYRNWAREPLASNTAGSGRPWVPREGQGPVCGAFAGSGDSRQDFHSTHISGTTSFSQYTPTTDRRRALVVSQICVDRKLQYFVGGAR